MAALVPPEVEAVLLVEYEADSPTEAKTLAFDLIDRFTHDGRPPLASGVGRSGRNRPLLESTRGGAVKPSGVRGTERPTAVVGDAAVPAEALPEYLRRIQDVLQRREVSATYLVSTAEGRVDMRPFLDLHARGRRSYGRWPTRFMTSFSNWAVRLAAATARAWRGRRG